MNDYYPFDEEVRNRRQSKIEKLTEEHVKVYDWACERFKKKEIWKETESEALMVGYAFEKIRLYEEWKTSRDVYDG